MSAKEKGVHSLVNLANLGKLQCWVTNASFPKTQTVSVLAQVSSVVFSLKPPPPGSLL